MGVTRTGTVVVFFWLAGCTPLVQNDAGITPDAGGVDAGAPPVEDAGADAGTDAGTDAGISCAPGPVLTYYADSDGDGYGDPDASAMGCSVPSGFVDNDLDCDDSTDARSPDASEECNEVDDDCDDSVDERIWYRDGDGDGWGGDSTRDVCVQPSGYVARDGDCDDTRDTVFPGSTATEVPNDGVDTDCDGLDRCTDFTCDGLPDLVITVPSGLAIYENTGASSFTLAGSVAHAPRPRTVGAADLDGDGYLDLAVVVYTGSSSANHRVYWGSASGFSAASSTAIPDAGARSLAIGDLGGDAQLDLAIATYLGSGSVRPLTSAIYISEGRSFTRREVPSNATYSTEVADLNGDGHDDVIFSGWDLDGARVPLPMTHVYFGSASGVSSASIHAEVTAFGGVLDIDATDLDGDGYRDLVIANRDGASRVFPGAGTPGGAPSPSDYSDTQSLTTSRAANVALADLDGDGCADLAFPTLTSSQSVIYFGVREAGACTWPLSSVRGFETGITNRAMIADLNADGHPDVVFSGDTTRVYWGAPDGPRPSSVSSFATPSARSIVIEDFEADGFLDLVVVMAEGTTIYWGRDREPSLDVGRSGTLTVEDDASGVLSGETRGGGID